MQRCFHVLHQLAKHFELTAIIHQDKKSFMRCVEEYPAIKSAAVFSTSEVATRDLFKLLPTKFEKAFRYRWQKKQLKGPADGNFLLYYPILTRLLTSQKFDGIMLENRPTLNAISVIRKYDREVKIIFNAHNVDSDLARQALLKGEVSRDVQQQIFNTESNLHQRIDALLTCSEEDKDMFDKMNQGKLPIAVVPNGMIIPGTLYDNGVRLTVPQYILFCGSLSSVPNAEGLYWFCNKIWPMVIKEFPVLKLLVVGSGILPEKYKDVIDTGSIEMLGTVPDVKPYYNKSAIAVVPLLTGSGTRLKILEAMALGVPVISTTIGAEGIEYTIDSDIIIADEEKFFAEKIIELLHHRDKRLSMANNARRLVESNYDWDLVGNKMAAFINRDH